MNVLIKEYFIELIFDVKTRFLQIVEILVVCCLLAVIHSKHHQKYNQTEVITVNFNEMSNG